MFFKSLLKWSGAAVMLAGLGGAAQAEQVDIWGLQAQGDVCRITFTQQGLAAGINRVLHHDGGCMAGMGSVAGYSSSNGGNTLMLYDAGAQMIGRIDKETDSYWVGMIGDGTPMEMSYMGQGPRPGQAAAPQPPAQSPNMGSVSACLKYYDSRACADPRDQGDPVAQGIGALQTLTRMNVRFLGNTNSQVIGTLERGTCIDTSGCRKDPFGDGLWCEIKLDYKTGWILKQDAEFVYSQNGCG